MQTNLQPSNRVVIIGSGFVGATSAFSLLMKEVAQEIMLIDIAEELAQAHVLDLQDAANFSHGINILFGKYADLQDGDIVVITAGIAQKPGETRTDLLQQNAQIAKEIFQQINATGKQLYILIVTNPVDVLTYLATEMLDQPVERIMGTGTTLDTARLKMSISQLTDINPHNIHAYILGEHGDSSFAAISQATAGGLELEKVGGLDSTKLEHLQEMVRTRAYQIIAGKKATYYGIGAAVSNICKAIIDDEGRVYTLSVKLDGQYGGHDVCIGVPVQIGKNGFSFIGEIHLSETEWKLMQTSIETVKKNIERILESSK